MKKVLWSLLLVSSQTMAATIAVIDSGVDVEHKDLLSNLWKNTVEIADNGRDEDRNGFPDDVWGWNFAEQNNMVIDRKYIGTFSRDPYKFFDIQGKMFLNRATQEEIDWVDSKRGDEAFRKEMSIFGNFVHGTHVAGITVDGNAAGKILSVKLIPTEVKPFVATMLKQAKKGGIDQDELQPEDLRIDLIKAGLKTLAKEQMKMMEEIAAYVGNHKADIANGSFGTSYNQSMGIIAPIFKTIMRRDGTREELDELARIFIGTMITEGKKMVASAPDTLFVFASGNDGMNNDKYPTSPTNIHADNVISVGATYKYDFIAPFSNYGIKNVDVAAPGMLIKSQVPGDEYLPVSGTSQAAPYVANVAAQIKDANKSLTPKQIKQILMGTVDEKGFLKGKIVSQGIVNMDRAVHAARLSLKGSVATAISEANAQVADVESSNEKGLVRPFVVTPIPLTPLFQ